MTEPSFIIESIHGGTRLEFRGRISRGLRPYEGFDVEVRLHGGGVEAAETVFDNNPQEWTSFFQGLARDWRGWEGVRVIESLEHQLRLSCTTDRLGHIEIRAELRGDMSGSDWLASDTIYLEAGQLDALARSARDYFGEEALSTGRITTS